MTPAAPDRSVRASAPPAEHGLPSLRVGRLFGVEIRLDWSVLFIFALITFNLGAGLFPTWHPDWGPTVTWLTALAAAVLFLVSILLHELSHAVVGRAQGIDVDRITLFIFGGVARMRGEPKRPWAELLMAAVGPITSLAIGIGSLGLGLALAHFRALSLSTPEDAELVVRSMGPVATLLTWLGPVNIVLGLFNLVPGFPLDGGRVLRAVLWGATGDFVKATRWAALAGQLVAWGLIGLGVVQALGGRVGQGLWLVLIGWFLSNAARSSVAQALMRESLADVSVEQLMLTQLGRVSPELSLEHFVTGYLMTSEQRAWPVEADGRLLGLAVWDDVRRVPHAAWSTTRVGDVMTPASRLVALGPHEPAARALELFSERDVDQLAVLDGERLLGLVRRADLLKWVALQHGEGPGPGILRPAR